MRSSSSDCSSPSRRERRSRCARSLSASSRPPCRSFTSPGTLPALPSAFPPSRRQIPMSSPGLPSPPSSSMAEYGSRPCEPFGIPTVPESEMPGQLVFPFGVQPALGRDDFILAPCNEQAFRFLDRWPDWPSRSAAIFGPHGSGKSHLARIWCGNSNGEFVSARLLNLEDTAKFPPGASAAIEMGDVASYAPSEERDRAIIALFERPSGSLLFTGLIPPTEWPVAVADLRSRFDA